MRPRLRQPVKRTCAHTVSERSNHTRSRPWLYNLGLKPAAPGWPSMTVRIGWRALRLFSSRVRSATEASAASHRRRRSFRFGLVNRTVLGRFPPSTACHPCRHPKFPGVEKLAIESQIRVYATFSQTPRRKFRPRGDFSTRLSLCPTQRSHPGSDPTGGILARTSSTDPRGHGKGKTIVAIRLRDRSVSFLQPPRVAPAAAEMTSIYSLSRSDRSR